MSPRAAASSRIHFAGFSLKAGGAGVLMMTAIFGLVIYALSV